MVKHVYVPCQISSVKGHEEEYRIAYSVLLDIEGKTEEAIATLETINNLSSVWHLAQVSHALLNNWDKFLLSSYDLNLGFRFSFFFL